MEEGVSTNEQDEILEWVAPVIQEWDVVAETQSGGVTSNVDGGGYS